MDQAYLLRSEVTPEDLQAIIDLHGVVYAAERGWNVSFKAYVAGPLIGAARGLSPRSRIWIAEHGGKLVGCIGMIEATKEAAQLRWLLVDPKARNQGLGKRLLTEALTFAREQGFDSVFLWTESSLTLAARLYAAAGFRKTEERAGWKWGARVVEERHELRLAMEPPSTGVEMGPSLPIIDVADLVADRTGKAAVAAQIDRACRENGFFYVVGHGVSEELQRRLEDLSRGFFAQPVALKERIAMALGGRAWRGYFRVGDELTSGKPDQKEGLYFGQELPRDHPLVISGVPLHGPNLFPDETVGLRETVLEYMAALTALGHRLMAGIALGLGLDEAHFANHGTLDPLILFRIFSYPPAQDAHLWGVGEHSDYGLLTILLQDDAGGLEVKSGENWVSAPPIPGSFVCNIGDMLDRMTRGIYRSTPHRVRNLAPRPRLSFPFFFDPNFFAPVRPIDLPSGETAPDDRASRWDQSSVHVFNGTYGDYLLTKVGKVFPGLREKVI